MYNLATHNALGPRYTIIGFARTNMTEEAFRAGLGEAAKTISEAGRLIPKSGRHLPLTFIILPVTTPTQNPTRSSASGLLS